MSTNGVVQDPPKDPGVTILACLPLPAFQLWIVADDASASQLVQDLRGHHLVLTLGHLEKIRARAEQRIVVAPPLSGIR